MTPNAKWATVQPTVPKPYTTPPDPAFGHQLRQYRERAGLSQEKLARRAGLTHSYISKMETGDRAGTMHAVSALVRALALPPDEAARLYEASGVLTDIRAALALLPDELRGRLVA